jgi:putative ABC transport system permease protein
VGVLKDLMFALRMVRRAPWFAGAAVLTLGLGIGANTAIFSLIDSIFLHGLPFTDAHTLILVQNDYRDRGIIAAPVSITKFEHFRDHQTTLTGLTADSFIAMTLTGQGDPTQVRVLRMSSNEFGLLGVKPEVGRLFRSEEDRPGDDVVLLSDEYWDTHFQRDPSVVGRAITLDGLPYAVVGVMPAQPISYFGGVDLYTTRPEEFPGITPELKARGFSFLRVAGRLAPGVSEAQAQANLAALAESYRQTNGEKADADWHATVVNLEDNTLGGQLRSSLWLLLGAVGFVLLIATSNVANLLLVRFSARRREISVRLSLGANRRRVLRLFLFESLLLSLLAAVTGVALARLGLKLLVSLNAPLPIAQTVSLSWTVLAFTIGVALLSGVAMGLYPSMQAAGASVVDGLKEGGRASTMSRSQRWFRTVLLGAQVALSCVLLIGAFLLVASVRKLQQVSPEFKVDGLFTAGVNLPSPRYPTKVEQAVFEDRVLDALRHAPGVTGAAFGIGVPFTGGGGLQTPYSRTDGKFLPYARRPLAPIRFVSSDYFSTLGIPVREGRQFTTRDRMDSPTVVILSEGAARTVFPEGGALGRHLLIGAVNQGENAEIVGIAADIRSQSLQQPTPAEFYRPLAQRTSNSSNWQLVVRANAPDPSTIAPTVREVVRAIDHDLPLVNPTTLTAGLERSIGPQRLLMTLLGIFAGLALLLAVVGIYSVVAYMVSQRRTEIGVRLALGAVPSEIVRLVMRQGMTPVGVGLVVGVAGAWLLGQVLQSQLFGTTPHDPMSFVVTVGCLLAGSLAACWFPSWRASRIGPASVLRG